MTDMLFNNMDSKFPKMGKVIDVCTMADHHVPETEFHGGKPSAPTTEEPQTTQTGMKKGPMKPFRGANS